MNQTLPCPFYALPSDRALIAESEMAFAIIDKFPVSLGHALVIPARPC